METKKTYKKKYKGFSYLVLDGKKVKVGFEETFDAYDWEIPDAFKDSFTLIKENESKNENPIEEKVEEPKQEEIPDEVEDKPEEPKDIAYRAKKVSTGWYDVLATDSEGNEKRMNEKKLRKEAAEELVRELAG
jgi:hypothetical protein